MVLALAAGLAVLVDGCGAGLMLVDELTDFRVGRPADEFAAIAALLGFEAGRLKAVAGGGTTLLTFGFGWLGNAGAAGRGTGLSMRGIFAGDGSDSGSALRFSGGGGAERPGLVPLEDDPFAGAWAPGLDNEIAGAFPCSTPPMDDSTVLRKLMLSQGTVLRLSRRWPGISC